MQFITTRNRLLFAGLCVGSAVLAANANEDEVRMILDRCAVAKSTITQSGGNDTMSRFSQLGDGSLTPTVMIEPNRLVIPLGMTEFWHGKIDGKASREHMEPSSPGCLTFSFPEMKGWAPDQVQDMLRAEIVSTWTRHNETVRIRSLVARGEGGLLIDFIENRTSAALPVRMESVTAQFHDPERPFTVKAGTSQQAPEVAWLSRRTYLANKTELGAKPFRMWAATAVRVFGVDVQNAVDNEWSYEKKKLQIGVTGSFTIPAGQTVLVVTKVELNGIPPSPEPADPLPLALSSVMALTPASVEQKVTAHRAWWDAYWHKAYVRLDSDPLMERVYYGCLYALACVNNPGHYPGGTNSFPTNIDGNDWGGVYAWDYNQEAIYYGAASNNRLELQEPYDRIVLEANEMSRRFTAETLKAPGSVFFNDTAPLQQPELTDLIGLKTIGLEAILNCITRYRFTCDIEYAHKMYPVFRDLAAYWDWDLEKNKETRPDGSLRYVTTDTHNMEFEPGAGYNAPASLAYLRRFYPALIEITQDLEAAGVKTGATPEDLARWQRLMLGLAEFPQTFAFNQKVFAYDEKGLRPSLRTENQNLYFTFPTDVIGLSTPDLLRQVAIDTIRLRPSIYMQSVNTAAAIFTQALSVGVSPPEIDNRFHAWFRDLGASNFKGSSGGNIENAGIAEYVSRCLLVRP